MDFEFAEVLLLAKGVRVFVFLTMIVGANARGLGLLKEVDMFLLYANILIKLRKPLLGANNVVSQFFLGITVAASICNIDVLFFQELERNDMTDVSKTKDTRHAAHPL